MSSQIVIFHPAVEVVSDSGMVIDYVNPPELNLEYPYITIGSSHSIRPVMEPLVMRLKKNTPIYCMDNNTSIKTVGEYIKSINEY